MKTLNNYFSVYILHLKALALIVSIIFLIIMTIMRCASCCKFTNNNQKNKNPIKISIETPYDNQYKTGDVPVVIKKLQNLLLAIFEDKMLLKNW